MKKDFDFNIPKEIEECIVKLENALKNEPLDVDLYQDEIRQLAHAYVDNGLTEEEANELINYYY